MYFTYILYSKAKNKYYVGHTGESLKERLRKHNTNHKGFTGGVFDWEVRHFEEHPTKADAYQRELEIKRWKSRKKIEKLIESSVGSEHPDL